MADRHTIHVAHVVNGTVANHEYVADRSAITMLPGGTFIDMTNGSDEEGRSVSDAMYTHAEVVVRRPGGGDG